MSVDFPETRWSQLLELRDPAHPRYAEHLEKLAKQYWSPVFHYAKALGRADAEDLAQQFFAMLLSRRDLEKISPERGEPNSLEDLVPSYLLSVAQGLALLHGNLRI